MTTSTVPASTSWFSLTGTSTTVPATRAATGVTCASTWASSVVWRPAVAYSQTDNPSTAITTATIAMRIRLFINSTLRQSSIHDSEVALDFLFSNAERPGQHHLRHE